MTTVQSAPLADPGTTPVRSRWQPWALAAICAASAVLYGWGLGSSWGNSYYSAAVRSMSQGFENFFFGSFDPVGVVTVDKPPMALWVQVLSTWVFGFDKAALLLPQVVAGVAAVFLLHRTVRRWAGEHAALLAALVLALTPITVLINRDNNPDTLLVLLVVAAAYAMTRSFGRRGATGWLALAAFLVGCGFLTKMLQAWMVLPAFVAAYLVGSRASWGRRVADLAVAAVVLLVSSFWWIAATALWPAPKPWIGGSTNGSAWDLVFGYNGFGRILGGDGNMGPGGHHGGGPGGGPGGGGGFSGSSGPLRLFNEQLGGQISWLLPLCLLVLVAVVVAGARTRAVAREHVAGWVLWGGWLVTVGFMFSFAQGIMHPYYTTMLAPAVGAVAGAGLVRFWRWYTSPVGLSWLLLPLGVAITAGWAFALVARDLSWHPWAGYAALALGAVALVALLVRGRFGRAGFALGLAAMLLVPTAWSALGATSGQASPMGGANPMAGPPEMGMPGGGRGLPPGMSGDRRHGQARGDAGETLSAEQRKLLAYVQEHAGGKEVPMAVEGGAHGASAYLLDSDLTVVGMGGFMGSDNAPSVAQLTEWKRAGKLGFVLLGGGPGGSGRMPGTPHGPGAGQGPPGMPGGELRQQREQWVKRNCALVDPAAYGGTGQQQGDGPFGGEQQLYSCG
ncbi:glycosyltransferase family 39 protein [Saccharopolyspora rosea]|uniref:ArnT family glycosyltransferase n=1 Tax=Saccharopolyspora rosea TaxID=524884 RepID=A0ABW3FR26_9PSEU